MTDYPSNLRELAESITTNGYRDLYINALWFCQSLEMQLKILLSLSIKKLKKVAIENCFDYEPERDFSQKTLQQILERLKPFFPPNKHEDFYISVSDAIKKRNEFVHSVFKVTVKFTEDEYKILNFDQNNFISHPESRKVVKTWVDSYFIANKIVLEYIGKYFSGLKIHVSDFK